MGSGASFCLVGVSGRLSRKPSLKTRDLRGFKLCSHRSSPYLPTGKATVTLGCPNKKYVALGTTYLSIHLFFIRCWLGALAGNERRANCHQLGRGAARMETIFHQVHGR